MVDAISIGLSLANFAKDLIQGAKLNRETCEKLAARVEALRESIEWGDSFRYSMLGRRVHKALVDAEKVCDSVLSSRVNVLFTKAQCERIKKAAMSVDQALSDAAFVTLLGVTTTKRAQQPEEPGQEDTPVRVSAAKTAPPPYASASKAPLPAVHTLSPPTAPEPPPPADHQPYRSRRNAFSVSPEMRRRAATGGSAPCTRRATNVIASSPPSHCEDRKRRQTTAAASAHHDEARATAPSGACPARAGSPTSVTERPLDAVGPSSPRRTTQGATAAEEADGVRPVANAEKDHAESELTRDDDDAAAAAESMQELRKKIDWSSVQWQNSVKQTWTPPGSPAAARQQRMAAEAG